MALALAYSGYASEASVLYRNAQKQEKAGHLVEAYLLYVRAATLDPKNPLYQERVAALKPAADKIQQSTPAMPGPGMSAPPVPVTPEFGTPIPPMDGFNSITEYEVAQARHAMPPPQLKYSTGRFDFHISGQPSNVFKQIAERCGLATTFDSEYEQGLQKVRFDINDVGCRDALRAAEAATNSFVVPMSSKLILISKDSTPKRAANEQTMSVVIPMPTTFAPNDITELAQAVKQVTGIEKLGWNAASSEIVIRDRISRVRVAMELLNQLTRYRGGVYFDLRFLQLSDSDILQYGVNLTNSFTLAWAGLQDAAGGAPLNLVFQALRHAPLAGFGITYLNAAVVAQLTQSKAKTILATEIQSLHGLPATLHVGEKYPIETAGYFGGTAAQTNAAINGTAYTPTPSFTYQDLGVTLKVQPVVTNGDLITVDLDTEYQLLNGSSIDGIPILANRKLTTRVCVRNDEWSVIGGLMDDTKNKSVSGVAGLARIPILGWLFKTQNTEKDRDHIVILLKPHIMGDPPGNIETPPMWVGPETRPLSPL